ncbi:small nuclear ribonucleoprotein Sm D3 [Verticillium alfalfae VaMs.102]|uniref:Small nuclear ribonucleoprotein Sm D3 n=1 Tax=Verticillium alfalfae (strain VaMs.102 / ATCC MYA-4576 / FGSC 10136) TaxID=526221 RepID=C9SNY3_VERA1|nr:small nuclear ribonucleoprotein Sm D3 [Verticillium alfalfae VaMs.102]EEY20498.1 small nuclear ribonucleoprotein Sm D3 [Verticillium alfalfae VaMs.102]
MTSTIGIPIKLLNEAQGHIITLEITSGQTYRGKLLEAEDNMNIQLKDITVTARDGRVSHLDQVYIRGSHVRFFIVPDMLRNAPMFRSRNQRGRGVGLARGRATPSSQDCWAIARRRTRCGRRENPPLRAESVCPPDGANAEDQHVKESPMMKYS